jgi:hypothetical protein
MASFMRSFRFQSAGTAYNLNVGFIPDRVKIYNHTKWATDGTDVEFIWYRLMGDAVMLSGISDDTGINRAIITSNGIEVYEENVNLPTAKTVSGATVASPPVITTSAVHGYSTGDQVRFSNVGGMDEINRTANPYKITVLSTTTFSLQDINSGENIDGTGFTAFTSGGQVLKINNTFDDTGFKGITLGTECVGANDDIVYVECYMDDYATVNLGDLA